MSDSVAPITDSSVANYALSSEAVTDSSHASTVAVKNSSLMLAEESLLSRFPPPLKGMDEIIFISEHEHVALGVACVRARACGAIAVDLEGVNLSRNGSVCIVQIAVARRGAPIFLFDISALGDAAFAGPESLRGLLEDSALAKLFFDCRADANALFYLHDVATCNIIDLQLADVAHRLVKGVHCDHVSGLGYLVERTPHARLQPDEALALAVCKAAARGLFVPELGGSYDVWRERPLPAVLREYCTDAALFFTLRESFDESLAPFGAGATAAVAEATLRRLAFAHSDDYDKSNRSVLTMVDPELVDSLRRALGGVLPRERAAFRRGGRGGRGGSPGSGAWASPSPET